MVLNPSNLPNYLMFWTTPPPKRDVIYGWSPILLTSVTEHEFHLQVNEGAFVASSPDEKALLEECRAAGFDFLGAALDGTMRVRIGGESGEQGCNSI